MDPPPGTLVRCEEWYLSVVRLDKEVDLPVRVVSVTVLVGVLHRVTYSVDPEATHHLPWGQPGEHVERVHPSLGVQAQAVFPCRIGPAPDHCLVVLADQHGACAEHRQFRIDPQQLVVEVGFAEDLHHDPLHIVQPGPHPL